MTKTEFFFHSTWAQHKPVEVQFTLEQATNAQRGLEL